MLSRKFLLALGVPSFLVLVVGCVITQEPTGTGATLGSGGESSQVTTTAIAATTGDTTTTGVGGTGGEGGAECVGETGTGVVADCDTMKITPSTHGGGASLICGPNLNEEPPGYGLCTRAFTLFTTGAATDLEGCLAQIGVEDECAEPPLQSCVDMMFAHACASVAIQNTCDGLKTTCGNDPFDAVQCAKDLNPFSDAGLMEVEMCINMTDPSVACQKAYDDCYTTALSF